MMLAQHLLFHSKWILVIDLLQEVRIRPSNTVPVSIKSNGQCDLAWPKTGETLIHLTNHNHQELMVRGEHGCTALTTWGPQSDKLTYVCRFELGPKLRTARFYDIPK